MFLIIIHSIAFQRHNISQRVSSDCNVITLTRFGFVLNYVLGDRTVSILTGRPAQIDVTTTLLGHVKIPRKIWRLCI